MSQTHQLAAIMFTDIAGYMALMGNDEHKAFELLTKNRQIQIPIINEFNGRFVKELGDGILSCFPTASDALFAAIKIQQACSASTELSLRIGIHEGETTFENNDIFGDAVNIASRIQTLGVPGSILFSKKIADEVKNKPEFHTVSLGSFEFKNVNEPIEIFALAKEGLPVPTRSTMHGKLKDIQKGSGIRKWLIAITLIAALLFTLWYFFGQKKSSVSTPEKSIAVLYFENMSGDSTQESFSYGITEDIITHISHIKNIDVRGHSSVQSYKGKPKNLEKIGKELNVSFILEGSVRKSGNTFRITAHLIDVQKGKIIWAEPYDRDMKDIFKVQSEIARMIAQQLEIEITPEVNAKISQVPTQNVEAYEQFQKGMYFLYKKYFNNHEYEYFEKSKKFFEAAIQLDSGYSEAYAGLAETYDELRNNTLFVVPKIEFPKDLLELKEKLARKALQLKPNSSYANTAMAWAMVHRQDPDFDSSFFYMKKAYYIDPKDPITNYNLSFTLTQDLGLNSPAIPLTIKAIKADPLDPNLYSILVQQYALSGKDIEAKKTLQTCFELSEDSFSQVYRLLFWLVYFGDYAKAESLLKALDWGDSFQLSFLYAAKGEQGKVSQEHKNNIYILLTSNRNKVMKDVIKRIESEVERGNNTEENSYDFLSHSNFFKAYRDDPDYIRLLAKAKINHDANMLKYGNIEILK